MDWLTHSSPFINAMSGHPEYDAFPKLIDPLLVSDAETNVLFPKILFMDPLTGNDHLEYPRSVVALKKIQTGGVCKVPRYYDPWMSYNIVLNVVPSSYRMVRLATGPWGRDLQCRIPNLRCRVLMEFVNRGGSWKCHMKLACPCGSVYVIHERHHCSDLWVTCWAETGLPR